MKNKYTIEDNAVKITLNNNQFTYIDLTDLPLVEKYSTLTAHLDNNGKYYVVTGFNGKQLKLHRILLNMTNPKEKVDHKDMDSLNNRRSNLRKATDSQNSMNRLKSRDSNTGCKNIMWHKLNQRYQVVIHSKETSKYSYGYFNNIEDAIKRRNEILKELHGEFAVFDNPVDIKEMPQGKPYKIATTGEKYISYNHGKYDVRKVTNGKLIRKRFKDLSEAIAFRNSLI